ncbi:TIGR03960 family B12-binding radical SAM protein [Chondromyces crocatus]|uniref:B12-binding protein n=1 Tax=Chondromyces crocatus TaxID=52 RepID=A0A0K1ESM4_CHOCO|nr:TIGR03960 family B12-binding radical SAM protein [Chondromyces crocatus]AKT43608.1 B12-binding protein [Chondromyces crocatus]
MDNLPLLPDHPYAAFLDQVDKPARYTGGEVGSIVKDWSSVEARVCLAFPDVYDIGMSHLGFKILYKILNDDPRTLAERCYAPWVDMEAQLVRRGLPLVALESARPLRDFDVVGFSLQFELTYSNILTMLKLGGIPLRAADREEDDPLVIAGGPVATHPEPIAPFLDLLVIGDGEEKATEVSLTWARLKKAGVPRKERLVALAKLGAVYVPSLYETRLDPDTGLHVVDRPVVPDAPLPVGRALVDLNQYPFPDDAPTGGPEAIFDRMSIEIARGCTEGCRFCQAGMIYRPVRERDPEQIVDTVMRAIKRSGQDEVSLTALSTADVSCISPLIKKIGERLAAERVTLGVSSLRAYGLEPELLDELKRVRAAGLTFAPEAGSQRMRDVVNKNVTEEQLLETAERVFSRGFGKMKLYFMIGLPTETDEDVRGIVETGARTAATGRRAAGKGKPADVTVSVSTHVPKPHTPFQWAAMDSLSEVSRKQQLLRSTVRPYRAVTLRTHEAHASVLEGIFARGDRPLADVLERAFHNGARFDSWDDQLKLEVWEEAFTHFGIDRSRYLGTLPLTARLPWDHIDVGLEEGFLAKEYRKAIQSRLSPPCGKVAGMFVHHTNLEDARADERRLVCYDCGVACDLSLMREERFSFLQKLGAERRALPVIQPEAPPPAEGAVDARGATPSVTQAAEADPSVTQAAGADPSVTQAAEADPSVTQAAGTQANGGATDGSLDPTLGALPAATSPATTAASPAKKRPPQRQGRGGIAYRLRYEKVGPMALLGHLDVVRELPRVLRRVGVPMTYTTGFHPKPDMTFGPALSLGVITLDEYVDVRLEQELDPEALDALVQAMSASSPRGLVFRAAARLGADDPALGKVISGARYLLIMARAAAGGADAERILEARCRAAMEATTLPHRREISGLAKMMDVRTYLKRAEVASPESLLALERAGLTGDVVALDVEVDILGSGSVKSSEVAAAIVGEGGVAPAHRAIRLELIARSEGGQQVSPLDLAALRRPRPPVRERPPAPPPALTADAE